jgi:hypothetical protein
MEVVYPCCCGLDVHKKSITACVLWAEAKGKSRKEKKRFGTFTHDLLQLADWLEQCGVTHAAMESTGVFVGVNYLRDRQTNLVRIHIGPFFRGTRQSRSSAYRVQFDAQQNSGPSRELLHGSSAQLRWRQGS